MSYTAEKKTNVEDDDDGANKEDQQPQLGMDCNCFPPERIAKLVAYTMAGKSQMNDNIPTSPDNNHDKVTNILNSWVSLYCIIVDMH